jgi:hypothetical protein
MQDAANVKLVDQPAGCNLQVRIESNLYRTLTADGLTASPPVQFREANAADHVASQLKAWARWFAVLAISSKGGGLPVDLDVSAKRAGALAGIAARFNRVDAKLNNGDQIEITVTNKSPRNLFVTILDLSSDGSIDVIYPGGEIDTASESMAANGKFSRTTSVFVPQGRTFATDTLKLFASTQQIDLRPLRQKTIRDVGEPGSDDPLSRLLRDATYGTKGIRPVDMGEWTTTQRTIFTQRSK